MKLVIDIPEEIYPNVKKDYLYDTEVIVNAFKNGIPLPKGHGRLIDESKINKVYVYTDEAIANNIKAISTIITGTDAPTIIEADKEN